MDKRLIFSLNLSSKIKINIFSSEPDEDLNLINLLEIISRLKPNTYKSAFLKNTNS